MKVEMLANVGGNRAGTAVGSNFPVRRRFAQDDEAGRDSRNSATSQCRLGDMSAIRRKPKGGLADIIRLNTFRTARKREDRGACTSPGFWRRKGIQARNSARAGNGVAVRRSSPEGAAGLEDHLKGDASGGATGYVPGINHGGDGQSFGAVIRMDIVRARAMMTKGCGRRTCGSFVA